MITDQFDGLLGDVAWGANTAPSRRRSWELLDVQKVPLNCSVAVWPAQAAGSILQTAAVFFGALKFL